MEFEGFPKIPRLVRECVITEKIDGTNGQVYIVPKYTYADGLFDQSKCIESGDWWIFAGSRNRWLSQTEDNHGFFKWVSSNREQLVTELGYGRHFGEWWGQGINARYQGAPKKFSLFNTPRWQSSKEQGLLTVCDVTPILHCGLFSTEACQEVIDGLVKSGSFVWPGAKAEGIVVYHKAGGYLFKQTCEHDEKPKGE